MLILKGGTIIDGKNDNPFIGTIVIENEMVVEIIKENILPERLVGSDAEVVDVEGKWLIPGLIDMHVHIKDSYAPLFVAAGVTTVRNTAGNVLELEEMRRAEASAVTPRIYSADRLIDGPPGLWGNTSPWNINVESEEEAKSEVCRQVAAGADFIKVYGWLSEENMAAVVDEAKRLGCEVSCDLVHSSTINAITAAKMGIKWNEHASGILQAMYPNWHMAADSDEWDRVPWDEPDDERIKEVCTELIENGVILCPTMTLYDQMVRTPNVWKPSGHPVTEEILKLEGLTGQWGRIGQYEDSLKKQGKPIDTIKRIAKIYHELGGRVIAGTDTPAGVWTWPGMALHRELELFVEAGFTEMDALRAATSGAAESMGKEDIGLISNGVIADIVILDENPLEDIRHTQKIDCIIKGGRLYTQQAIFGKLLSEEETMSSVIKFINKFENGKYVGLLET